MFRGTRIFVVEVRREEARLGEDDVEDAFLAGRAVDSEKMSV